MFMKIQRKHREFKLSNINNLIFIISFLLMVVSIYIVNNYILLIFIYLFILELSFHSSNKSIRFLTYISGIFVLVNILIKYNFFAFNFLSIFLIICKIILILDYLLILIRELNYKKNKYLKRISLQKRTFKNLRKSNLNSFLIKNRKIINNYIKQEALPLNSEEVQLLNDNLLEVSKNDLEEYVYSNYLKFYKYQKKKFLKQLDLYNFVFLSIHVIILILSWIVR